MNTRITDWPQQRVWIVGASSGIGAALAQELQARGAHIAVSARRREALEKLATLPSTIVAPLDICIPEQVSATCEALVKQWGRIDLVVWLAGNYKPMHAWDFDRLVALDILATNYGGLLNGLDCLLPQLIKQNRGGIAIVASVAGYRGLPKALAYGPTKAAMINLAEILHGDLHPKGISVYLVNPGFVETPLTAQNTFAMPGLLDTRSAAAMLIRGLERGRFEITFPWAFTTWMKLLRLMPNRVYLALMRKVGTQ
jgi:short-subunit dehydrogenase